MNRTEVPTRADEVQGARRVGALFQKPQLCCEAMVDAGMSALAPPATIGLPLRAKPRHWAFNCCCNARWFRSKCAALTVGKLNRVIEHIRDRREVSVALNSAVEMHYRKGETEVERRTAAPNNRKHIQSGLLDTIASPLGPEKLWTSRFPILVAVLSFFLVTRGLQ